jgi:hypothetical protein
LVDHNLYVMTHSTSFSNLTVIDLRGNNICYPMTLKVNSDHFYVPNLEELYLNFYLKKNQNSIENDEEAFNYSNDISFVFSGCIDKLTKLNVLWLKGIDQQLVFEENKISNLQYKKLHLDNVRFTDTMAEELLKNLGDCQELDLLNCETDSDIDSMVFSL